MGQEQKDEGKSEAQLASTNTQNSTSEKEEHCVEFCPVKKEEKRKEKGMEEGEMKKELEMELQLCQSLPGQQMSFIRGTDLFGYVGIEAVLDQMRRKTMKAGFEFNIMVVGEFYPHEYKHK